MKKNQTKTLYICGTDILQLNGDPDGVVFYSSLDDLIKNKKCLDDCGIKSIEINLNDFKTIEDILCQKK